MFDIPALAFQLFCPLAVPAKQRGGKKAMTARGWGTYFPERFRVRVGEKIPFNVFRDEI